MRIARLVVMKRRDPRRLVAGQTVGEGLDDLLVLFARSLAGQGGDEAFRHPPVLARQRLAGRREALKRRAVQVRQLMARADQHGVVSADIGQPGEGLARLLGVDFRVAERVDGHGFSPPVVSVGQRAGKSSIFPEVRPRLLVVGLILFSYPVVRCRVRRRETRRQWSGSGKAR